MTRVKFTTRSKLARHLIAAVAFTALSAAPVLAANARHPHRNVDHRVDKGGDTGDSQVEKLNQQQLDSLRSQNGTSAATPGVGAPMMDQQVPAGRVGP